MKKVIIVAFIILALVGLYEAGLIISKYYFKDDSDSYTQHQVPTAVVDNDMETIISNVTQFIVQTYDVDNNVLTEETIQTPIEYMGYTREQLLTDIRTYAYNPSVIDKSAGLTAYELVSFEKRQVIVRKSYSVANLPDKYRIYVENGVLTIYLEDGKTLYDYTEIELKDLPQELQLSIISGMQIDSQQELYEFLETYTS